MRIVFQTTFEKSSSIFQHFVFGVISQNKQEFNHIGHWKHRNKDRKQCDAYASSPLNSTFIFPPYNKIKIKMTSIQFRIIALEKLSSFLQQIQQETSCKRIIKMFNRQNDLNGDELMPKEIYEMAEKLENRVTIGTNRRDKEQSDDADECWMFGEQKLFCSILPYFCYAHNIKIEQLNLSHTTILTEIFITKTPSSLLFEIRHVLSLTNSIKPRWSESDLQNLANIVSSPRYMQLTQGNMKWKHVAFELFLRNGCTVFHAARDCREKWINHLNPGVSKAEWQTHQDLEVFLYIRKYGCKWALISKKLKGIRTQHMIKNRVNALIKKYINKKSKSIKSQHIQIVINSLQHKVSQKTTKKNHIIEKEEIIEDSLNDQNQQKQTSSQMIEIIQNEKLPYLDIFEGFNAPVERYILTQDGIEESWQYNEARQFEQFEHFVPRIISDGHIFDTIELHQSWMKIVE